MCARNYSVLQPPSSQPPSFQPPRAMPSLARLPDWVSLPPFDRLAALEQCQKRLVGLGRKLNAVEDEFPVEGARQGLLTGMPYVAKDMFATGRSEPSWGCSEPQAAAEPRAWIVDRLDSAGACLIGTATMTELAYEPSGLTRRGALNPWRADAIPGGSSTGSAILVASGCCFAALGSDTGGSVRIPAHCCGVTGLKTTYGVIPPEGTMSLAPSLDTIGFMARSAADLALIWGAVFGDSERAITKYTKACVLEDAFASCDAEIAEICRNAIAVLARSGMTIKAKRGFPEQADQYALLVLQAEAASRHRERMDDRRINPTLRKRLGKGLAISDEQLGAALAVRDRLRNDFLSHYIGDAAAVALLPVMPMRTPDVAEVDPASPRFSPRVLYAISRFTRFANYLGLPALAVPAGFDRSGTPVGLQIVGPPGSDAELLDLGIRLQARTDWHGRVPAAIAGEQGMVD
jgi:Asp-tRNA(Asn)/Glu-tRNA(Gln) amidotransferase A subunit family amidase